MKGYLFSLEVLIAILIILSSLFVYNFEFEKIETKDKRIYEALDLLERENKINSEDLEVELENILGFDVEIDENCKKLRYLVVEGSKNFRVINVCY